MSAHEGKNDPSSTLHAICCSTPHRFAACAGTAAAHHGDSIPSLRETNLDPEPDPLASPKVRAESGLSHDNTKVRAETGLSSHESFAICIDEYRSAKPIFPEPDGILISAPTSTKIVDRMMSNAVPGKGSGSVEDVFADFVRTLGAGDDQLQKVLEIGAKDVGFWNLSNRTLSKLVQDLREEFPAEAQKGENVHWWNGSMGSAGVLHELVGHEQSLRTEEGRVVTLPSLRSLRNAPRSKSRKDTGQSNMTELLRRISVAAPRPSAQISRPEVGAKKHNLHRLRIYKIVLFAINLFWMLLFASYVVFYMTPNSLKLIGWQIFVARASAFGACLWTAVLFVSMSRNVMTWLAQWRIVQQSELMMGLLSCHKEIHVFAAIELILDSVLHTTMHLSGTFVALHTHSAEEINECLSCNPQNEIPGHMGATYPTGLTQQCPLQQDISYSEAMMTTTGITGMLMLFMLFCLWMFSRVAMRVKHFNVFWIAHNIFAPSWCVLLVLHAANGWVGIGFPLACIVCGVPVALYCCSRLRRIRASHDRGTEIDAVGFSASDQLLEIRIKTTWSVPPKPGQYAFLQAPEISRIEWHPFTISGSWVDDEGHVYIRFIVQRVGDWTGNLHRKVARQLQARDPYLCIRVDGPFFAPTQSIEMRDVVVGVGAGVGVTPFLAFLEHLAWMPLDQWVGREYHIFWMTRHPTDFLLGGDILERLQDRVTEARELCENGKMPPALHVHLHVTGLQSTTLAGKLFLKAVARRSQRSFEPSVTAMSSSTKANYKKKPDFLDTYELVPAVPVPIYFGRPEWTTELSAIGQPSSEAAQNFNVYICGNPMLVKSIETDVEKIQSPSRRFIVEHERFS